jgi:tRNA-dihydrouridine synthase
MQDKQLIYNKFRTEKLDIGPTQAPNRVILAPMSGITDAPFRRLAEELGAGLVVSEMTACAGLVRGEREAAVRSDGRGVDIHVVQLAGCEANWMAEGARIAEAQGADIVDINMGCPSKQVTNGASGSALMRDLDHALGLIEATVSAVQVPVTLKMRLGWDASAMNAPDLARRAEAAGVKLITSMDARVASSTAAAPIGSRFAPSSRRYRFPSSSTGISTPATMQSKPWRSPVPMPS